ncbi:DNA repair helicase XPB [Paenibacillus xylaniclasticus]|uniref:DNA repair helicase XPB n=1 Tax=Paenibacillus xylaniclasticus TaxID=588083 RepID=UPI000FDAE2D5|nr:MULTISPECIES: DNA repair helicase XPB [Paenibacillus]GFN32007.1 DEAD/DEAH box helicase [Paenibacillus curdlanolyticus]
MQSNGKPIIVLSDMTLLFDERMPGSEEVGMLLAGFTELVKNAGPMHTYRITPLTLWNAASLGMTSGQVIEILTRLSKYDLPRGLSTSLKRLMDRYGRLRLDRSGETGVKHLSLSGDEEIMRELDSEQSLQALLGYRLGNTQFQLSPDRRGAVKQELLRLGYPVIDAAGYRAGESLKLELRRQTLRGSLFSLRDYQKQAVDRFVQGQSQTAGSGVIVLPCGAGKTLVGIGVLAALQCATLILTSSLTSVQQWQSELLDKTTLDRESIGQYSSLEKQVKPVTIATYNMLATSGGEDRDYRHMRLFGERDWGLIIYDEVHMLPAPVFRMTADLQATRRLGLTATLIREDGRERDVFSLIGPKLYELPWKQLEQQSQIAELRCEEVRVPLPSETEHDYLVSDVRKRVRLAAENPNKMTVVRQLLDRHKDKPALIIGSYIRQLKALASEIGAPLLTGEVPHEERAKLYEAFRRGEERVLVVSKIANFAVDLPDAAVAVQVSGSFGSRQEEAQRIGRLLRPKQEHNSAVFYTVVSDGTMEVDYAMKRQRFMTEQGYRYGLTTINVQGGKR